MARLSLWRLTAGGHSRAEREAAWFEREAEVAEAEAEAAESGRCDAPPAAALGRGAGLTAGGRSPVAADLQVPLDLAQACQDVRASFCTDGNLQVGLALRLDAAGHLCFLHADRLARRQLVDYIYRSPEALPVDVQSGAFPSFSNDEITVRSALGPQRRASMPMPGLSVTSGCWPEAGGHRTAVAPVSF